MKDFIKLARKSYEDSIQFAVKKTIEEVLSTLNVDVNNSKYYVEILTEAEAESVNEQQYDEYMLKYNKIYGKLNILKEKLSNLLEEVDELCKVFIVFRGDNTIDISVEVDKIEFELYLKNEYNNK